MKPLLKLLGSVPVHALAHITGGGLLENIPRVIPAGMGVNLDIESWPRPAIFEWLQQHGNISENEMYRTFNMGIGMVVCVSPADSQRTLNVLNDLGEHAWRIGQVESGHEGVVIR